MLLLLIFLIRNLNGQLLHIANETFPTLDGQGTIINQVNCDFLDQQPSSPFQNIFHNNNTGEITIKSSGAHLCIVTSDSTQNMPSIEFRKSPELAKFIKPKKLNISINHQLLNGQIGSFNFSVVLSFKKSNQIIEQKQIIITSSNTFFSGNMITQIPNLPYRDSNGTFVFKNITNTSFQNVLQLDQFTQYLFNMNALYNNDTFIALSIKGKFTSGSYQTKINYTLSDVGFVYIYDQENLGLMNSQYPFYFKPTPYQNDYQYLAYPKNGSYTMEMHCLINSNNTEKSRYCSGERIGYYNNGYHIRTRSGYDLDYFPLDPALQTKYYISSDDRGDYINSNSVSHCFGIFLRRDYDITTDRFTNLADETLISQKVYVCNQNFPVLQQGLLIQQFVYQDPISYPSHITFKLYQKGNINPNQPFIYSFLGNIDMNSALVTYDLFFFVNRLFKAGKFRPNERISQISKCLRIFSGINKHTFLQMIFPTKSQISHSKTMRCDQSVFGCLACSNLVNCLICDTVGNWIIENGQCVCKYGFFQKTLGTTTICQRPRPKIETRLSCLLLEKNTLNQTCSSNPLQAHMQVALSLTSTPNIEMVMKISQLICLVDEFMFYAYTNMTYNEDFKKFIYMMWNLSVQRWVPYSLSSFYYDIQDWYDEKTKVKSTTFIPELWADLKQDSSFIRNTRDYWISSIPLTVITFVFLHICYRILKKLQFKFSDKLLNFKWFVILFVNIFLNNLQLLAFRAFQQILYGVSPDQNSKLMYFLNQCLCYVFLFCVVITACAGQYIIRIFIGMNVEHAINTVWYSSKAIWLLIILQITRVTNGFVHAKYHLDNQIKFSILLGTQILLLATNIHFRLHFRLKSMFLLMVTQYLLKILVHLSLFFRVLLKLNQYELPFIEQETLGNMEITLIWMIFGVAACQLFTTFITASKQSSKPSQSTKPSETIQVDNKDQHLPNIFKIRLKGKRRIANIHNQLLFQNNGKALKIQQKVSNQNEIKIKHVKPLLNQNHLKARISERNSEIKKLLLRHCNIQETIKPIRNFHQKISDL